MKFGSVTVADAVGLILGHNIVGEDGRRVLRKGKVLDSADIQTLTNLNRKTVYVAELEAGDVDENTAARTIAKAVAGPYLRLSKGSTGRVNIYAEVLGLARVDVDALLNLNELDGVTLATLITHSAVAAGKMVATLKIIPYAVSAETVTRATPSTPLLTLDPLKARKVGLILSGFPTAKDRIVRSYVGALTPRLAQWGSQIATTNFVPLEDEADEIALANAIQQQANAGKELIILAGDTAIMDRFDIAPRAVERAGGRVAVFGAPVDPGNLLMLGYLNDIPIVGAPGCSRSPKENIVDWVLPRLLAGDHLTKRDIVSWGHGGMIDDVPERPLPRSKLG